MPPDFDLIESVLGALSCILLFSGVAVVVSNPVNRRICGINDIHVWRFNGADYVAHTDLEEAKRWYAEFCGAVTRVEEMDLDAPDAFPESPDYRMTWRDDVFSMLASGEGLPLKIDVEPF